MPLEVIYWDHWHSQVLTQFLRQSDSYVQSLLLARTNCHCDRLKPRVTFSDLVLLHGTLDSNRKVFIV
jgi:hypothetical protein